MDICLVEDHAYKKLYPLTKTRPIFGLRCGRFTIEERILNNFPGEIEQVNYVVRPEQEAILEAKNKVPGKSVIGLPREDSCLIFNGRMLFDNQKLNKIVDNIDNSAPGIWLSENTWTAIFLPEEVSPPPVDELIEGKINLSMFPNQMYLDLPVINHPWDLIHFNSIMIRNDFSWLENYLNRLRYPPLPDQVAIKNSDQLMIGDNTEIYPFVTFDCTRGPIIVGDNVTIESGAFVQGPVSIGNNSLVSANTKVYRNTTIGETCKVGGEISHSIMHGFSNKRHCGFLGNSYIGEWVNLGAGTNNSNMKNNYNKITVHRDGKEVDTGKQFVGLFMGDHSRTAIGTQFNTATFVGVGCNIFGNGIPPQKIEDFTWGGIEESDIYEFQKFIENVKRMMIRREKELSNEEEMLLKALHKCRSVVTEKEKLQSNGSPKLKQDIN